MPFLGGTNALVSGFLVALERGPLPGELRMRGLRRWVIYVLTGILSSRLAFTAGQSVKGAV
jgi:hypothetical protein